MTIQKIFSEVGGEEKYYSVLMNEEDLVLFDEMQREFTSVATKMNLAKQLGGSTQSVFRGALGKAEGQMFGGYGKWNREMASSAANGKMKELTKPQQVLARRRARLNNGINNGNFNERLNDYKMAKKMGYFSDTEESPSKNSSTATKALGIGAAITGTAALGNLAVSGYHQEKIRQGLKSAGFSPATRGDMLRATWNSSGQSFKNLEARVKKATQRATKAGDFATVSRIQHAGKAAQHMKYAKAGAGIAAGLGAAYGISKLIDKKKRDSKPQQ